MNTLPASYTLLVLLRSHFLWFHTAHHVASGPAFVGDHKLYLKIYEQSVTQADTLAEKLIQLQGPGIVSTHALAPRIAESLGKTTDPVHLRADALALAALAIERTLENQIALAYREAQQAQTSGSPASLLGLENLLATFADDHSVWLYQLQQRTRA